MICFILIIMCKLVKLVFCLCCGLIDSPNVGVAVGIRQLILQHSLNCKIYCIDMYHNLARFGVYSKKANQIYAASGVAPVYINRHLCIRGFMYTDVFAYNLFIEIF